MSTPSISRAVRGGALAALTILAVSACGPEGTEPAAEPAGPSSSASATTEAAEVEPTGPEQRTPGPAETLQLLEGQAWPDGTGEWVFAVVVENPADDLAYFSAGFDVVILDEDGQEIDGATAYTTVGPGATAVVTGTFRNLDGLGADQLVVQGPDLATVVEPGSVGSFEVKEASLDRAADGRTSVVGTVASHFATDQEDVSVVALLRDADGTIVAAESGWLLEGPDGPPLDVVRPGDEATFRVNVFLGDDQRELEPEVWVVPSGVAQGPA